MHSFYWYPIKRWEVSTRVRKPDYYNFGMIRPKAEGTTVLYEIDDFKRRFFLKKDALRHIGILSMCDDAIGNILKDRWFGWWYTHA